MSLIKPVIRVPTESAPISWFGARPLASGARYPWPLMASSARSKPRASLWPMRIPPDAPPLADDLGQQEADAGRDEDRLHRFAPDEVFEVADELIGVLLAQDLRPGFEF